MIASSLKYLWTILFCLITISPLNAAGPITHAYLAKQLFPLLPHYTIEDKKAFMRGTLFPDIRYLGKVARTTTHYENVTLNDIINEKSPFIAGMKYHSWVDIERNHFVNNTTIKSKIPAAVDPNLHHSYLKLVEEEIVYEKDDWNDCCEYLYEISPEELNYQMDKETILRWHGMLTLFFKSSPATALSLMSLFGTGSTQFISRDEASKWAEALPISVKDPVFIEYLDNMLKFFEQKLNDRSQ